MTALNLSIAPPDDPGNVILTETSERRSLRSIRSTEIVYAVFVLATGILLFATAV